MMELKGNRTGVTMETKWQDDGFFNDAVVLCERRTGGNKSSERVQQKYRKQSVRVTVTRCLIELNRKKV